jgi:hypothetical protein
VKQEMVNEGFKKYIEAEITVMLNDIGPNVKPGSTRFAMSALKWIERNAADFRMKWDKEKNLVVGDTMPSDRKEPQ